MSNLTQHYTAATHLREAAPYIRAYSQKKVAVLLNSPSFSAEHLNDIAQDIALLYSLGIQPVVIVNPYMQTDPFFTDDCLNAEDLIRAQAICNKVSSDLTAKLSVGLINSCVSPTNIPAISGNFVVAKPKGIINGKDLQHNGEIRQIKHRSIAHLLERQFIVMITPFGFSPSGETYFVDPYELTLEVARSIEVEKIAVIGESLFSHQNGEIMREWRPSLELAPESLTTYQAKLVQFATKTLLFGIQRIHILVASEPGSLIQELFTRDGCGTMATLELYEQMRMAVADDAGGLFELIQPLEEQGILVKRPREQIEAEIDHFTIIERDNCVIGCCALYPYSDGFAELACLVVSPKYRSRKHGDTLLNHVVQKAIQNHIKKLFVLTTKTADWFVERGFKQASLDDLPVEKRGLYNMQRNSKIFIKTL